MNISKMKKQSTKSRSLSAIKNYYRLTKPGVLYGNVLTAAAGFLFASRGDVDFTLFLATILGTTLVIASACAFNNYFDRDIDSAMPRTKSRPIVAGLISGRDALVFASLLAFVGAVILFSFTNLLVIAIGFIGFVYYVFLYGMWAKRRSVHGTLVGSISGAAPILAGYVAASGRIDLGALLVFAILFFWQMPEFYSIAIYRREEYKAAKVPVITVIKGVEYTKRQIFAYALLFAAASISLAVLSYASHTYLAVMSALCACWLWLAWRGLRRTDDDAWSRSMFRFSLIVLLSFCFLISIDNFLP